MTKNQKSLSTEVKYQLYEASVQCHEADIDFLKDQYKKIFGRKALTLREDFGGTAALACGWVSGDDKAKAWAIDLDPEPIKYGKENHLAKLTEEEQSRMHYVQDNVLDQKEISTDIVVAFNFSYFIFKKRNELLAYFKSVKESLGKDGVFFVDIFGGTECFDPIEEETEFDDHSYFWDLDKYNPITNECMYGIHFKWKNHKYKWVFSYDWRMWTVREVREIMEEAGFSKTMLYWEEDGDDGEGNGVYYQTEDEENSESWVAYIGATV